MAPPGATVEPAADSSSRELLYGDTTDVVVTGLPPGQSVEIQQDAFPFDERWSPRGGRDHGRGRLFTVRVRPRRNTRYRTLMDGVVGGPETIYVDLRGRLDYPEPRGDRIPVRSR